MTVPAAAELLPIALAPFAADWEDPTVEDIFVNGPGHYFVRRGATTERKEAPELDALAVEAIAVLAAHMRGQDVGEQNPILDCELSPEERLNAILYPCTPMGRPSLAIRRTQSEMPTLDFLNAQGLFKSVQERIARGDQPESKNRRDIARRLLNAGDIVALLRHGIACRWTIGFTGETASGKTFNTKAIAMEIPLEERVVTVANSEELARLPHENRLALLYSKGGPVKMEQLVEAALRNAPRWLLVPEVRGPEAFSFLWAAATGHPGITSWHAPSAEESFDTLEVNIRQHPVGMHLPEKSLRQMMKAFVDLVVHVERRAGGTFGMTGIAFGWEQA